MSGETLVNMQDLDMIVGSGGVLSHAPRREQACKILIDSFLPEGITELSVDSIFMMPQLGVLASVHEKAAIEVFNKDCLVRLGTCIAPLGEGELGQEMLDYTIYIDGRKHKGSLKFGEMKVIRAKYEECKANINLKSNFSIQDKTVFEGNIYGGEVGIILDGRGRPFNFNMNTENRKSLINIWRNAINEYPDLEI